MKKIIGLFLALAGLLMSCDNPIRLETNVHADGSLEKVIILKADNNVDTAHNMFGISAATGWQVTVLKDSTGTTEVDTVKSGKNAAIKKDVSQFIRYQKKFESVAAVNQALDNANDTLFHLHSTFEKRFRWFYTYIYYSETWRPINRFKHINAKDYFNLEDSLFLNRLPGEGTRISKADSLFLANLNNRISEQFVTDALFAEYYTLLETVIRQNTSESRWLDTLARNKELIYRELEDWDGNTNFAPKLADLLKLPLPKEQASKDFAELSKDINSRVNFMSAAQNGQYTGFVTMPWTIIDSNADSVAGNKLYWRPVSTQFAVQPYTLFAVSRQLNMWAVLISLVLIGFSVFVWLRSRARS